MQKSLLKNIAVTGLLLFASPAAAQETTSLLDLPAGQTLLNLSATERVEVEQDVLVATLRYEAEDTDPKALQNEINEIMKEAAEAARAIESVKVSTQQYYVYPHDPYPPETGSLSRGDGEDARKRTWRGSQGIELKSAAADDLLALTGRLQEMGLVMSGLNYMLSPEKMEETKDALMEDALAKVKAKADRAAGALGKTNADMLEVTIESDGGYYPQPMMRSMAMDSGMAEMATPVAEPGESEITLTVSAKVLLKP